MSNRQKLPEGRVVTVRQAGGDRRAAATHNAAVLKRRHPHPDMALPHDGVSPADDVTDLLNR
jgi:hypothetical protein